MFFNFANPTEEGSDIVQQFRIPENITDRIDYRILTAPDVMEKTNIKWAGQTVGPNGDLQGDQETVSLECYNGCLVEVPGPGAALVMLGSEREGRFFNGNSTIAPYSYLSGSTTLKRWPLMSLLIVTFMTFVTLFM